MAALEVQYFESGKWVAKEYAFYFDLLNIKE